MGTRPTQTPRITKLYKSLKHSHECTRIFIFIFDTKGITANNVHGFSSHHLQGWQVEVLEKLPFVTLLSNVCKYNHGMSQLSAHSISTLSCSILRLHSQGPPKRTHTAYQCYVPCFSSKSKLKKQIETTEL